MSGAESQERVHQIFNQPTNEANKHMILEKCCMQNIITETKETE